MDHNISSGEATQPPTKADQPIEVSLTLTCVCTAKELGRTASSRAEDPPPQGGWPGAQQAMWTQSGRPRSQSIINVGGASHLHRDGSGLCRLCFFPPHPAGCLAPSRVTWESEGPGMSRAAGPSSTSMLLLSLASRLHASHRLRPIPTASKGPLYPGVDLEFPV